MSQESTQQQSAAVGLQWDNGEAVPGGPQATRDPSPTQAELSASSRAQGSAPPCWPSGPHPDPGPYRPQQALGLLDGPIAAKEADKHHHSTHGNEDVDACRAGRTDTPGPLTSQEEGRTPRRPDIRTLWARQPTTPDLPGHVHTYHCPGLGPPQEAKHPTLWRGTWRAPSPPKRPSALQRPPLQRGGVTQPNDLHPLWFLQASRNWWGLQRSPIFVQRAQLLTWGVGWRKQPKDLVVPLPLSCQLHSCAHLSCPH